jgi:hypothetical protein
VGISLFRKKPKPSAPDKPPVAPAALAPQAPADGVERMTANDWARKFQVNEVQAERAAMRAGRWYDLFTEQEFLELIKKQDA